MKIIAGVEDYDGGLYQKSKFTYGLLHKNDINSSASVFEEMSKPFEHLKNGTSN